MFSTALIHNGENVEKIAPLASSRSIARNAFWISIRVSALPLASTSAMRNSMSLPAPVLMDAEHRADGVGAASPITGLGLAPLLVDASGNRLARGLI